MTEDKVWRDVKLPAGKILIPAVVSHSTDLVEHPELVADRIITFTEVVGRENVVGGTDCGLGGRVHPQIAFKQMPSPKVNFVEAPHVSGEQRLQDAPRREAIDLQQQVEVIRHQDIGAERERVALAHGPKRFDEGLVVTLPEENLLPVIAPRHHVIEQSFRLDDSITLIGLGSVIHLGLGRAAKSASNHQGNTRNECPLRYRWLPHDLIERKGIASSSTVR